MPDDLSVQLRRVGDRRSGLLRRLRPEYQVVICRAGAEIHRSVTIVPSTALVSEGKVHTTDSYDWVRAADDAFLRRDPSWITDPFEERGP